MHIKIAPLSFAILTILQATHVKAVPTFSGTEYTYTQPDGTWWTGYKYFSNIDIGGCSLTNIGYKNDNTGTFKMIATKNGCNIEEYLNPVNSSYQPPSPEFGPGVIGTGAWAQPPNPYYQQRDYADQGNISYKNGKLSINDKGFFTNTLTDTSNDNTSADYLVITSKRANTALVEVAVDTTLNVGKNLYIQQSVTNAAALLIQQNAAANIQGNLALWRQHSADPDGTTTDSRVLDMQSGTLTVDGDLITNHFESIVSRNSGASWLLKNNSKVSVGGNATVYQNTEASAISSEKSNIDITGDLKIFIDKRSNLDHRKDDTAPAIYNNDSAITANTILISSEGFVGINQIGESAIINTKNLNIDTTANNYNNSENIDKSIIIAGGKIIAEVSDLKTNGDALTVNGVSSLSLGENTPPTLNLDQNKALIKLGADSKIQSTASHGIVINNNIDSDIDLQNGTQIIVENNKNLLLDADGNATLHIYEGAVLSGNITLNGGNEN